MNRRRTRRTVSLSRSVGSSKGRRYLSQSDLDGAIAEVAEKAASEQVHIALIGGAALQLYGSDRLTADVDFAADGFIKSLPHGKRLAFGGEQTKSSAGVPIDLVVRDDRWAALYAASIETAQWMNAVQAMVARPEYLLAMKMQARRDKDEFDVAFLLSGDVVNLRKARQVVATYLGEYAAEELSALVKEFEWKRSR